MSKVKGSCQCGSIKYECLSDPVFSGICHCTVCQKLTGSAFNVVIGVQKSDLVIAGSALKKYEDVGDSGKPIYRYFCSNCGSLIMGESGSRPNMAMITAGSLDDSSWLKPQVNVYWRDHQSWISEIGTIPKHETMRA